MGGRKALAALLAAAALALALLAAPPARAADGYVVSPYTLTNATEYLLPGMAGSSVLPVLYVGNIIYNRSWSYCTASAVPSSVSYGGLAPEVSASCSKSSTGAASVYVRVTFEGTYEGGNYTAPPFSSVTVNFYYANGSLAGTVTAAPSSPVSVVEDSISNIIFINATDVRYVVEPSSPAINEQVQFVPEGTAALSIVLARPVSGAAELDLSYGTGSATADFSPGAVSKVVSASGFPLTQQVSVTVSSGGYTIYTGEVSVGNYGGATVAVYLPIVNYYASGKSGYTSFVGQVDVAELLAGSLSVELSIDSHHPESAEFFSAGFYNEPVVNVSGQLTNASGYYIITYSNGGLSASVEIPFSLSLTTNVGNIIYVVFLATFVFMVFAGAAAIVIGLLMRNLALAYGGLVFFIGAVLLFVVPTILGAVIQLLNAAGFQDPALVGVSLTVQNLGKAVDASLRYIYMTAMSLSNALLALATTVSIVAGALTIIAGEVAGDLVMLALAAWLLYAALRALAVLFPIFITVTLVVILFIGVLQILVGALTGNVAPALETIVNLSSVILLVLLTPVILATLNKVAIANEIKILGHPIPSLASIVIALIEVLLLVLIMVFAFQRMLSALGGAASVAASL